jgi:hypothetical protein
LSKGCEGRLDVALVAGIQNMNLQPKNARCRLRVSALLLGGWAGRVDEHADFGGFRHHLAQHLQLFGHQSAAVKGHPPWHCLSGG